MPNTTLSADSQHVEETIMSAKSDNPPRGVVLVVDDEAAVRDLSRRILERTGYGVLEAADGQQALELVMGGAQVDFLIVDLQMPIMRGEELARRVRAVRPELRVLYVTGHIDALFADRPELDAGEAFLDKPFTVKGLIEAVSLLKNGYINPPPPTTTVIAQLWHAVSGIGVGA
jgi:CheY-like chemotaxis protein